MLCDIYTLKLHGGPQNRIPLTKYLNVQANLQECFNIVWNVSVSVHESRVVIAEKMNGQS